MLEKKKMRGIHTVIFKAFKDITDSMCEVAKSLTKQLKKEEFDMLINRPCSKVARFQDGLEGHSGLATSLLVGPEKWRKMGAH